MQQSVGEQVELFISCRGLKNLNNLYISDPQVYIYEEKDHQRKLLGHTEVIRKNLNPDFKTTIRTSYFFNRNQELVIEVNDSNESILGKVTEIALKGERKETFIGGARTTLSKLMGAPDCLSKLDIYRDTHHNGKVIIFIDKVRTQDDVTHIDWQWCGKKLRNTDWFSKSDPFCKFFKYTVGNEKVLVHQTEVVKNDLNPVWKSWNTTKEQICQKSDQFHVEVWDYDRTGGHDFIGACDIKIEDIVVKNINDFPLLTEKHKDGGHLSIRQKQISAPPPIQKEITFLDYLRGNWQLSLVIGIDYTFSNGPINKPDSLHGLKEGELNQYQVLQFHFLKIFQRIINDLGSIIISYDADKQVPVYGFGCVPKLPNYHKAYADDCFPINGNKENPYCKDIEGIMEAYKQSLPHLEFSGPTFIANILSRAKDFAEISAKNNVYTVVICMTDGQVEDMEPALQLIGESSPLPMSIIIVGVGDENFKYMKTLENIQEVKKHAKPVVQDHVREITQFVAFKDYQNDVEKLTETVLDTFPKQFMQYMKINNIQPKVLEKASLAQIQ